MIWTDMLQSAVLVAGSIAIFAMLVTEINAADYLSRDHLNIINLDFDLGVASVHYLLSRKKGNDVTRHTHS